MEITAVMRRNGMRAWVAPLAMASFHAIAEPHVSTTANQAHDMAPWWVWWLFLTVATLVIYPAVLHFVLRRLGLTARVGHLVGLGFIHLATGAATIVLMIAVSIAYAKTSPMVFVGIWAALTAVITAAYVLFKHASSRRRPGHP